MKRAQVVWMMAAVSAVLAIGSGLQEGGFRRSWRLSQDARAFRQRNEGLAQENTKLRREIEALKNDPRALERVAREELGFVRPGELVLKLEAP